MRTVFVTASGTEIGKTLVTTILIGQLKARGLQVAALKPVLSGFNEEAAGESDPALILSALGEPATPENIARIAPWRFTAPLSPDMAAAREGKSIDFDALVGFCRAAGEAPGDCLLIEGVGGVMVPLSDEHMVRDWIAALAAPAVVVVGSYLGTISHTLSAVEALRGRNLPVAGVVVSESVESPVPLAETGETLRRFLPGVPVETLPRLDHAQPAWQAAPDLTGLVVP